jgi:hypothetical protein
LARASYNTVNVNANGLMSFTNSITGLQHSNQQLPYSSYTTLVAPFWDDLYPTGADNVYWEVLGTAPNRELVIEWRNVRHYSMQLPNDTRAPTVTLPGGASLRLPITCSSTIRTSSSAGTAPISDKGGSATIGVQVSTTDATQIGFNSQILSDNLTVHWTTVSPCTNTGAIFRIERTTGNVCADGSFNSGGADVAEYILASEPLEPGDVVELDPHNPKHYRKVREPYSPWVAGVISTAPGFVLGAKHLSLALSVNGEGRGEVEPGERSLLALPWACARESDDGERSDPTGGSAHERFKARLCHAL